MGPLAGIKVVEMGGLGPCPHCAMMLADLGADVIRIDRKISASKVPNWKGYQYEISRRNHSSIAVDLKTLEGKELVQRLAGDADVLIEGFRPGTMEKLGLGPDDLLALNPRLVYGRMTGWGQDGPLSKAAGHDINYISLTGALHSIGTADTKPVFPLALVGDFGGGSMLLAVGVLSALLESRTSGKGQVVDAAIVDGVGLLMAEFYAMKASGFWGKDRGQSLMSGACHYYDVYETADGKYISLGTVEPQFYALLREKLGLVDPLFDRQNDPRLWPQQKQKIEEIFKTRTRDEWCQLLENTDVCFAPVLSMDEAPSHPHNTERKNFVDVGGMVQPAPAPRFSRSKTEKPEQIVEPGSDAETTLARWGFSQKDIGELIGGGTI